METVKKRVEILKGMHEYVLGHISDEEAYMSWICIVPDEPDDTDFRSIAEDDELWKYSCRLFGRLLKRYEQDNNSYTSYLVQ